MKDSEKFRNIFERVIWKFFSTLSPLDSSCIFTTFLLLFLRSCYLLQRGIDYCLIPESAKELVSSSSSAAERKLVLLY